MAKYKAPTMVGRGENSYAHNSTFQRNIYERTKKVLEDAIRSHFDPSIIKDVVRVVDLGCSVGPNTFYTIQTIIDTVSATIQGSSCRQGLDPEFQVFFNDQVDNDFNVLFSSLPPERGYFPAAAPGSFYARLFPRDSIHLFNSTMALHWLSRAPEGVANKGKIHYYGGGPEIQNAYAAQFRADMKAFLTARAEELKEGGLISILMSCRDDSKWPSLSGQRFFVTILEPIFLKLVKEGKVKEEDLDAFQIPMYSPTIEEFTQAVELNGRFAIRVAQVADQGWKADAGGVDSSKGGLQKMIQSISATCRAGIEELLQRHFGETVAQEIFQKVPEQVQRYVFSLRSIPSRPPSGLFILQLKPSVSA